MATIQLAVSYLDEYEKVVAAAVPRVVAAFAPFGVHLQAIIGYKMHDDPGDSQDGWSKLITQLTHISSASRPPSPAHLVVTFRPPGLDPTINGQLQDRMRGICAVFLGANTFQHASPDTRLALVVQVMMHELGHMLDLTHGDDQGVGYPTAMTPTAARLAVSPVLAWQAAAADAATRGEPVVRPPAPVMYYPFGTLGRAALRQASFDDRCLPWRSAFRGNFDVPFEKTDQGLAVSLAPSAATLTTDVHDGLAFTLALHNHGRQAVVMPMHLGPEFGTLRVALQKPDGGESLFRASSLRCSSATQEIMPGVTVLRSFSLVPHPDDDLFALPGRYVCRLSVIATHLPRAVCLGLLQFDIDVTASSQGKAARKSAAHIVGGNLPGVAALQVHRGRVKRSTPTSSSPALAHARYKLAIAVPTAGGRMRALARCIDASSMVAVRHRAARRMAFERLLAGEPFDVIAAALQRQFDQPEDVELHETLQRMGDGWKAITT